MTQDIAAFSLMRVITNSSIWPVPIIGVLAIKPELALYYRGYEGPRLREYLERGTQGQQAARILFSYAQALLCHVSMTADLGTRRAMTQQTVYAQLARSQIA